MDRNEIDPTSRSQCDADFKERIEKNKDIDFLIYYVCRHIDGFSNPKWRQILEKFLEDEDKSLWKDYENSIWKDYENPAVRSAKLLLKKGQDALKLENQDKSIWKNYESYAMPGMTPYWEMSSESVKLLLEKGQAALKKACSCDLGDRLGLFSQAIAAYREAALANSEARIQLTFLLSVIPEELKETEEKLDEYLSGNGKVLSEARESLSQAFYWKAPKYEQDAMKSKMKQLIQEYKLVEENLLQYYEVFAAMGSVSAAKRVYECCSNRNRNCYDPEKAIKFLQIAAELGDAESAAVLASHYSACGDQKNTVKWYQVAMNFDPDRGYWYSFILAGIERFGLEFKNDKITIIRHASEDIFTGKFGKVFCFGISKFADGYLDYFLHFINTHEAWAQKNRDKLLPFLEKLRNRSKKNYEADDLKKAEKVCRSLSPVEQAQKDCKSAFFAVAKKLVEGESDLPQWTAYDKLACRAAEEEERVERARWYRTWTGWWIAYCLIFVLGQVLLALPHALHGQMNASWVVWGSTHLEIPFDILMLLGALVGGVLLGKQTEKLWAGVGLGLVLMFSCGNIYSEGLVYALIPLAPVLIMVGLSLWASFRCLNDQERVALNARQKEAWETLQQSVVLASRKAALAYPQAYSEEIMEQKLAEWENSEKYQQLLRKWAEEDSPVYL